ncbi:MULTISPECIES: DUF4168 domain-containing protein [Gammaproteobacteria]|jgi:intergrase/recombinase|uniref:DUF4168 domain-containing protein n=1 Tax=Vreelandella halophila TaxID=86177 RepID=A0A9X4YDI2_9GAMM|nr:MULTISPECIES: DUF4168 domain-containing protein [Gammaproteobacteria]KAA8982493.1 DUF4168 domain-containing protein [Halospina sp. K52047b]MYL27696.1 DUF4168 domain-containing protein [Halomonas utahensis]MYL75426.1 DUF4168 domain-containing protein [Halomonas sp. 22501_18_FS]
MKLKALTAAIAFALSTAGMTAVAQDSSTGQAQQNQGQSMSAPEQQNTDFSDEELQNFVELQDEIGKVREDYVSQIESAESEDKARELQQKAQTEMVKVIEDAGMTVEEYNAIAVAYNSNPEIQERVDKMSE